MMYVLIPLAVVAVMGVMCLNVKVGFIVSDKTEDTGFGAGFYMMTVIGLMAAEISAVAFIYSRVSS
jgi:hypothetical protein